MLKTGVFANRPVRSALCHTAAAALVAGLALGMPATAQASDQSAITDWSSALATSMDSRYSAYNSDDTAATAASKSLPASLDLRTRGVVTPVKNQGDTDTCWAHGAIAASETSILSELGTTYEATKLDLSERYLVWFVNSQATEAFAGAAQAGEGFEIEGDLPSFVFRKGGFETYCSTLFSAGVGPVNESVAPFGSSSGKIECIAHEGEGDSAIDKYYYLTLDEIAAKKKEWDAAGVKYEISKSYAVTASGEPDLGWGLSSDLYGQSAYTLEESSLMPDVSMHDANGNYTGINQRALSAIKEQLNLGRGVQATIQAAYDNAGTPYYNENTGSLYTNSKTAGAAHTAEIVGYDDNYDVSNFREGNRPPANGAFLIKDSDGASTNEFPNYGEHGIKDAQGNYTGYFWVSYYDHNIVGPASYDYDVNSSTSDEEFECDQYNFMAAQTTLVRTSTSKVSSANVFTADSDRVLRALSCETAKLDTQVTYEVYLLNDGATTPTDGTCALTKTKTYAYGGYHRCLLDEGERVSVKSGQRYAVVVTERAKIDGADMYYQTAGKSSSYVNQNLKRYLPGDFVAKVNEGESYTLEADGQWSDWTAVTAALSIKQNNCCVDNLPIKAFYQVQKSSGEEEPKKDEQTGENTGNEQGSGDEVTTSAAKKTTTTTKGGIPKTGDATAPIAAVLAAVGAGLIALRRRFAR